MKKNNKGKGRQHINVLKPSLPDTVTLCDAVEHRFKTVTADYFRIKGEPILPPVHYNRDMELWRTMAVRFRGGDLRNTDDELKSVQRMAQWTLDVKKALVGKPREVLEWAN